MIQSYNSTDTVIIRQDISFLAQKKEWALDKAKWKYFVMGKVNPVFIMRQKYLKLMKNKYYT